MTSPSYDTHTLVKRLEEAGFTERQAEILARELFDVLFKGLVTREYLDFRLAELRADIVKWVAGLLIAQGGIIIALIKLL